MYRKTSLRSAMMALLLGTGAAFAPAAASAGTAITCGSLYTVSRGDTLFKIAERTYADGWQYKAVHAANRDFLPTAESIEIGDQILIPCLDGSGPASRNEALAAAAPAELIADDEPVARAETINTIEPVAAVEPPALAEPVATEASVSVAPADDKPASGSIAEITRPVSIADAGQNVASSLLRRAVQLVGAAALPGSAVISGAPVTEAAPMPAIQPAREPAIRMLAGKGLAPSSETGAAAGEMVGDIVARSMEIAAPGVAYSLSTVNDWDAHLAVLLPGGAYDVSFPWVRPDCNQSAAFSAGLQNLCSDYTFSRPLLEVAIGYYVQSGDALSAATDTAELAGRKLCRPMGQFVFDLQQRGLTEPLLTIVAARDTADCFARLLRGEVDMVSVLTDDAEAAIGAMGRSAAVAEAAGLRTSHTIHAVSRKGDMRGEAALAVIDRGVERLMLSGGWFDVVASHRSREIAVR